MTSQQVGYDKFAGRESPVCRLDVTSLQVGCEKSAGRM